MLHFVRLIAATLAALLIGLFLSVTAPASALSAVKVTDDLAHTAFSIQEIDCYAYRVAITGTDPGYLAERDPRTREPLFEVYYRARCNPKDQRAAVMAHRSAEMRASHSQGLRTGWCFRWIGASLPGSKVSATCAQTVQNVAAGTVFTRG